VEERLGKTLTIASKLVREHFDQALRGCGSSLPAFLVLRCASSSPGVSQRELADKLGIEGPTLVRHVDRLVRDGLVERVPHTRDRRISHVRLTPRGKEHLERIDVVAMRLDEELTGIFTKSELATLYRMLHRISDRYGRVADVHDRVG
jgi:MarR family transcriptional regulator for hemolysin